MAQSFSISGRLAAIYEVQNITDKFNKREFAIEIPDGNYTQAIKFQLNNANTDLIEAYSEGDEITVHFNLSGKWFADKNTGEQKTITNLVCWKLEYANQAQPTAKAQTVTVVSTRNAKESNLRNVANGIAKPVSVSIEDNDDLPF